MKTDIFISYRRSGGESLALLVYYRLTFAGYRVFLDVERRKPGKFNEAIYQHIDECTDFLLILPPDSLTRCKNEGDWVRLEIARAIEQKKNIILLFAEGFIAPDKSELPTDIQDVLDYQGVQLHSGSYSLLLDELINNFLHSKPGTVTLQETTAPLGIQSAKEAKSLIYVKQHFRCSNCGSRKLYRQDKVEKSILFWEGARKITAAFFLCLIALIIVCAIFIFTIPELSVFLESLIPKDSSIARIFFRDESGWIRLFAAALGITMLPGYAVISVLASIWKILYNKEIKEGPHSAICICRNCGMEFWAISADKCTESWTPDEELV